MRRIYLLFILLIFSMRLIGQTSKIVGVVKDASTSETLVGVNIILENREGTVTDLNGRYELETSKGEHTLTFRFIGYQTQTKKINLSNFQTTLNIALKSMSEELDVFVVSSGKFEQNLEELTVSMEVLKPNIIENKNTTSIETALEQVPGVTIVDNEPQIRSGSGYSFGAGSRVMILIDDLPFLSGDAGRPTWSSIPVENLEQVEIIKGASSVLYGSAALNGVINIKTAYPRSEPRTKINFASGIYNNPKNKAGIYWQEFNPIFSNFSFLHSRQIRNLDFVIDGNLFGDMGYIGPEPLDPSDPDFNELNLNRSNFEQRARVNMNLRYRNQKIQGLNYGVNFNVMESKSATTLIWLNADTGMYRSYPGSVTRTIQNTYNIDPFMNYHNKTGGKHSLRSRIYSLDNDNDNNQGNFSDVIFSEYQFQQQFDSSRVKDLTLTVGISAIYTQGKSDLYTGNKNDNGINNASNQAIYLQVDKVFKDRLTTSFGLRYEQFSINGAEDSKPVFRGGLNYCLAQATFLRASFGQGFRFPTIGEKFIRTGVGPLMIYPNTKLKAENSWNAEIGIKQGFKVGDDFKGYLDIAYFRQEYNNFIEFIFAPWQPFTSTTNTGFGFKSVNTGKARVSGVDISVLGQGKIGEFTFGLLGGYTYTLPVSLTPEETFAFDFYNTPVSYVQSSSNPSNNILKYRFQHLLKFDIEIGLRKWKTGISMRYNSFMQNVDGIFEELDEDQIIPTGIKAYRAANQTGDVVIDHRISYQLTETSKLAFITNNLLNHEYMLRPMAIMPPRTTTIQFSLNF